MFERELLAAFRHISINGKAISYNVIRLQWAIPVKTKHASTSFIK